MRKMNGKLVKKYLILTFSIMLLCWGGSAVISQIWNITINNPVLRVLFLIGGFSPTIASYLSLKSKKQVNSLKIWLQKIFRFRQTPLAYGLAALFVLIYFGIGSLVNGVEFGAPIWMQLIIVPSMLFGGGNEEAGWRMILQPELEKQYGFHKATIVTAVVWWIWHFPIFFIHGTANAEMNFFLFGIMCFTLSYGLAVICKVSDGVFPCVLTHCLINGLSATFAFPLTLPGCVITLALTVAASLIVLKCCKKVNATI